MTRQKTLLIIAAVVLLGAGVTSVFYSHQTKEDTRSGLATRSFIKPSPEELRKKLTPLQYRVTQEEGTERPHANEYDKNTAPGLYVDIVSGEPLFSSSDKYDSGTGWPSFVKPLSPEVVVEKKTGAIYDARVEIRSRIADSHLGHVFDDGPKDRGGKRYCMNSSAMKFISKAEMATQGYSDYLKFVE